jgi:Collagen triple helix repeat (20 copies)
MRTPSLTRPGIAMLAAVVGLLLGVLGVTSSADAATINACYKRSSGVVRILRGVQRCRRHEVRFSWNTQGPAGKNGAAGRTGAKGLTGKTGTSGLKGPAGANGADGAVAGYSDAQTAELNITAAAAHVLNEALPAGSYVVSAKVQLSATAKEAAGVDAECKLVLATATGESVLDSSGWTAPLVSFTMPEYLGSATVALDSAVNLTAPGSVFVSCETLHAGAKEETVTASKGQLVAVQTASNS